MNNFDNEVKKMIALEENDIPDNVKERIENILESLPERNGYKRKTIIFSRVMASVACAAAIALFVMPNISHTYASAAGELPIIGSVIRAFTIRNYSYSDDTHEINIDVPSIETFERLDAAEIINKDVAQIAEDMTQKFKEELGEGNHASYLGYSVVTQNEKWFTLRLEFSSVAASGENYYKYYHIDKISGEYVTLSDLFRDDRYIIVISDDIINQMKKRMSEDDNEAYWIDDDGAFTAINPDQNFYFNKGGDLVIVFDEYEVAPGYMGNPEFIIEKDVYANLLKQQYVQFF